MEMERRRRLPLGLRHDDIFLLKSGGVVIVLVAVVVLLFWGCVKQDYTPYSLTWHWAAVEGAAGYDVY